MNKLNIKQVEETQGGSMTSFCAGFIAGSAFAYSVGFSTGPIGIGLVLTASVLCLAGDSNRNRQ